MAYNSNNIKTQNELLMSTLMDFYNTNDSKQKKSNFVKMMNVVNGESKISLRIIDWFVTNYAKFLLLYTVFQTKILPITHQDSRFIMIIN